MESMGTILGSPDGLTKLGSLLGEEYEPLKSLREKIVFLKAELEAMNAFLVKMSEVEEPDEQDKFWMKEVQKLSHDIQDSINDFTLYEDDKATWPKGFKGFIIRSMNLPKEMKTRHRIATEVHSLRNLVMQLGDRHARFKVQYNISKATNSRSMEDDVLEILDGTQELTNLPFQLLVSNSTGALGVVVGKLTAILLEEPKLFKPAFHKIVHIKAELEAMHAFLLKMSQVEEPDKQDEYWVKEMQKLSHHIQDSINYFMLLVDDKTAKPKALMWFIIKAIKLLTRVKTRHRILKEVGSLQALVSEVGQRHARYKVDYNISKATSSRSMEHDVLEHILDGTTEQTNLPFELLKKITRNFSESGEIGHGGFGKVYKGVLQNGTVAVKRILNRHTIDEKLFYREVNSLLNVKHENVVRFLGYCACTEEKAVKLPGEREYVYAEIRERLLCFEYISNGSLHQYITDELRGLDWNRRYQIIKQICEGLHYLHKEKYIFHMDLKPENILLNDHMVAKITDFGLSRLDEKSQTTDAKRCVTLGYCAPEYLHDGKMSFKSDVYSLGVIIIELVTGSKDFPDKSYVLRKWRHRWRKSPKETPWVYQELQISKCIGIGLRCQEIKPYKRPFISDILWDIEETERTIGQISNSDESDVSQISNYWEDDILGIEPLELHFPFELNKQISCLLQLTNDTGGKIAFNIESMSPMPYCIQPKIGIVQPLSNCTINIMLEPQSKPPNDMQHPCEFILCSTKVTDGATIEDITPDMFHTEVVDEVNLDVVFDETDVSLYHI